MLERFSVSLATTTILAVLGKFALLYHAAREAGNDWFASSVDQSVVRLLLLVIFLIFFRGKMMHDDATFFAELAEKNAFRTDRGFKLLIKLGLLLGYISWLLWGPAIYFLEEPIRFSGFMITSLALSTVWLVIDILTRKQQDWRRAFWIVPNGCYISLLVLLQHDEWSTYAAAGLVLVLIIDWLISDPFSGHIKSEEPTPARAENVVNR